VQQDVETRGRRVATSLGYWACYLRSRGALGWVLKGELSGSFQLMPIHDLPSTIHRRFCLNRTESAP
jgi:hypothetical protein